MSSVLDRLWLPGKEPKVYEGKVKLELFDARTGKLQQREEQHNYATDLLVGYLKVYTRQWLHGINSATTNSDWGALSTSVGQGFAGFTGSRGYGSSAGIGFFMTDASHAEDQVNDRQVRGTIGAFAWPALYSGSDTYVGSQNQTESSKQYNKDIFVFDWPTNSGNGNFQSVYFGAIGFAGWYESGYGAYSGGCLTCAEYWLAAASGVGYGDTWTDAAGPGGTPQGVAWLDPDGVSYWKPTNSWPATGSTTLVKRTLGTGVVVATIALTGITGTVAGFTNDGAGAVGNWWISDGTILRKYPAGGGAPTTSYSGQPATGKLTFGGGYLYLVPVGAAAVYQYSPTTGALITTITLGPAPDAILTSGSGRWVPGYQSNTGIGYMADSVNGDELWIDGTSTNSYYGNYAYTGRFNLAGTCKGLVELQAGAEYFYSVQQLTTGGGGYFTANTTSCARFVNQRQFLARSLLPGVVTKTNTQTMKLTYEFDYS